MKNHNPSRRAFAKKLAYAAPVILTLKAQPSFAAAGSDGRRGDNGNRYGNSGSNRHGNSGGRRGRRSGRD